MTPERRAQLVAEGRTRWFCVRLDTGSRFPLPRHTWARDEADAREQVIADSDLLASHQIVSVEEQHR